MRKLLRAAEGSNPWPAGVAPTASASDNIEAAPPMPAAKDSRREPARFTPRFVATIKRPAQSSAEVGETNMRLNPPPIRPALRSSKDQRKDEKNDKGGHKEREGPAHHERKGHGCESKAPEACSGGQNADDYGDYQKHGKNVLVRSVRS